MLSLSNSSPLNLIFGNGIFGMGSSNDEEPISEISFLC